jgi:NADPH:quinone reductase-like Zn-dependent oxidoreductase
VRAFAEFGLVRLGDGRLRPVIDQVFPLAEAAQAYAYLEHQRPLGKVVLQTLRQGNQAASGPAPGR